MEGGGSCAYQSGVQLELIMMFSNWESDSVLLYLTALLNMGLQTIPGGALPYSK